ncbi:MAG: MBL fold metallo-hydrolase [Methylococcaceae bacterium]|nr:MBL fold metallo-hydrolase [Methylococcaceae bacterium]
MAIEQTICPVCGYNMIGKCPDRCPFCGAYYPCFLSLEECSKRYLVIEQTLTDQVSRLESVPKLGLEHAAYRVDTGQKTFLIDCPVSFDSRIVPVDFILFTHPHFLGASNLYRDAFGAEVWIHREDAENPLARPFPFDHQFTEGFTVHGIEAYPIGGHTPGFTIYAHGDVLFVCDYVFLDSGEMRFNPHGPTEETQRGGKRLWRWLEERDFATVCGWNYAVDYDHWRRQFAALVHDQ